MVHGSDCVVLVEVILVVLGVLQYGVGWCPPRRGWDHDGERRVTLGIGIVSQGGTFVFDQRVRNGLQVACNDLIEFVQRQVDAVVCESVLREIIGPDAFAPVAGSDQGHAFVGALLYFGFTFGFVQASLENA